MSELFDHAKAPAVERLARMEGGSNFLSLLAGIEAGPDTTEDVAALAFSRGFGGLPEALEAYIAQSNIYRMPLMAAMFAALKAELKPKEKDYAWMQGAVADAFLLIQKGYCKPSHIRAKQFKVREEDFRLLRRIAHSILWTHIDRSERAWVAARFRDAA